MQRFKQPNMDLHPDGEWIRYSDHCEAMKRIAGDGGQQAEPVAWVDEKAEALVFGGWDKQPFAKSYKPVFYATPSASAQQAIYQCMCTDDDNGREDVWMDVTSLSFEQLSKRHDVRSRIVYAAPAPSASPEQHPDDVAVDMFAKAMKGKLAQARAKGRSGWQTCNKYELSNMLRDHVEKGDPRDVANFCMFLHALGHPIQIAPSASPWVSINPAATLADRLDELPEINFSNYDQGDVEALQAWAIEAYTLLNASPAPTNVKKEG